MHIYRVMVRVMVRDIVRVSVFYHVFASKSAAILTPKSLSVSLSASSGLAQY